jgi:hypothetical protein
VALLTSEIQRLRWELGYNTMGVAAEPYVEYHGALDRIISLYLNGGAVTTSTTEVTASTTPAQVTLTLADATGFAQFAPVIVDVDSRQERATVQGVSGPTISLLLTKAHGGTYPVTVEGGESIVRDLLKKLENVNERTSAASATAGLKRAEDIEWYGNASGGTGSVIKDQWALRMYWRDQLASALGVTNLWRVRQSAGQTMVLY